jgi:hypothetical protein
MPRTRDPLDDLELPESPREPRTPWLWMILAVAAVAVVLWMLLSFANEPPAGGVREGRLLDGARERVGDVHGGGRGVVVEQAPALGGATEQVGGLGHG